MPAHVAERTHGTVPAAHRDDRRSRGRPAPRSFLLPEARGRAERRERLSQHVPELRVEAFFRAIVRDRLAPDAFAHVVVPLAM
jgi:hypothetical protein